MRWSTFVEADGVERAAVWDGIRLRPVPGRVGLLELMGDDGTRLHQAGAACEARARS